MSEKRGSLFNVPWEVIAAVAALVGLLLPVAAVGRRLVAFIFSTTGVPAELAASLPVSQLAVLGFLTVLYGFAMSVIAILPVLLRASALRTSSRSNVWFGLAVIASVALIATILVAAPWFAPSGLIFFVAGLVTSVWFRKRANPATGRPTVGGIAVTVGGLTLAVGLTIGLVPTGGGIPTVDAIFEDDGTMDGRYSWVATDGGMLYLLPCEAWKPLVRVSDARVKLLKIVDVPVPAFPPTLIEILRDGREYRLGFVPECEVG